MQTAMWSPWRRGSCLRLPPILQNSDGGHFVAAARIGFEGQGIIQEKGIACAVARYEALDTFANLGRQRQRIREERPNLRLGQSKL
jgi:hypothetical protein